MLDRAAAIRRGTIQMVQSSLQSAEAHAAVQRRPTTLSERFENRRVDNALEERMSKRIEGLRCRSETITRVVHASVAMVARLAALARYRLAKRETEAEYWRRSQESREEFVPVRDQIESQKPVRTKGRGR